MTALAQGSGGLALVMCFTLLCAGPIGAAAILVAVQCAAVAMTAALLHQPLMVIPPLVLGAGFWLVKRQVPMMDHGTMPVEGARLALAVGTVLAILCQSQGGLALPAAIVLLSILVAATGAHKWMHVLALVATQNGLILVGCLVVRPAAPLASWLIPIACLALPVPLAAYLLAPAVASAWGRGMLGRKIWDPGILGMRTSRTHRIRRARTLPGWIDLGLALAIFAATLIVPLDSLASVFAPLLALDGVLKSWVRRNRHAIGLRNSGGKSEVTVSPRGASPTRIASRLAQTGLTILAVCAPDPVLAWLAVLAAIAIALLPTLSRRWSSAVVAFISAGLALFGILLLPSTSSLLGFFSLFAGFAMMAAIVPDLAVVLVILILRLADGSPWAPAAEAIGIGVATIALLACAVLLTNPIRAHRATLLTLSQASIAALAICTGQAEGRFAALILLILLILTRAAARVTDGLAATLAMAGLGGVPPLGVFPGLVLVALAITAVYPWLLLPVGAALIPMVLASVPRHIPDFSRQTAIPSIAWLPLLAAVLVGYFAPNPIIHWWRILTAGRA